MNQYLFLFPVKEYFETLIKNSVFKIKGHKVNELFDIINARYRTNRYDLNWLLFSQSSNVSEPDLNIVPDYVDIRRKDRILVAGISFDRHISEKVYADPDFVLNQLPTHNKLVIGGFHQWDCVNSIARKSYERGIETFVDEDTTDLFFLRRALYRIPLIRKRLNLKGLGIPEHLFEVAIEVRKNKPWFVQV